MEYEFYDINSVRVLVNCFYKIPYNSLVTGYSPNLDLSKWIIIRKLDDFR